MCPLGRLQNHFFNWDDQNSFGTVAFQSVDDVPVFAFFYDSVDRTPPCLSQGQNRRAFHSGQQLKDLSDFFIGRIQ